MGGDWVAVGFRVGMRADAGRMRTSPQPRGGQGRQDDPAREIPAVDEVVIEKLASITDSQGFSVLGELFNAFLSAVPVRLDAFDRAVASGALAVVAEQAHALTGSSASFAAPGMADICRRLRAAAERDDLGAVRSLVRDLHGEFLRVRAWLVGFRSPG